MLIAVACLVVVTYIPSACAEASRACVIRLSANGSMFPPQCISDDALGWM